MESGFTLKRVRDMTRTYIQNLIDISRFNDYLKLLCVTAYVIRFVNNIKQKVEKQSLNLQFFQPIDIENAESQ